MDPIQETPEAAAALLYTQPVNHHEHQMARPCFNPASPPHGRVNQPRSYDSEKSTSLGWTCHPNGRQQTTEATDVWCARLWEAKARQASQEIQTLLKGQHKPCRNTPKELESLAHGRTGWRALTRHAIDTLEERHSTQIEEARERRKASADAPGNPGFFPCPHCPRTCKSRIALHSHLRAHGRREQR